MEYCVFYRLEIEGYLIIIPSASQLLFGELGPFKSSATISYVLILGILKKPDVCFLINSDFLV